MKQMSMENTSSHFLQQLLLYPYYFFSPNFFRVHLLGTNKLQDMHVFLFLASLAHSRKQKSLRCTKPGEILLTCYANSGSHKRRFSK